jgi:D-serine deaminase-like pyridoxal phosphate-dependent protein
MMENIETPALIIDEKKMQTNIERMLSVKKLYGIDVRPHFKTHKSSFIAKEQIKAGACGITVATVSEAEVLLRKGFTDILIAYPLIEKKKVQRLFPYKRKARLIFTIDSKEQADLMLESLTNEDDSLEVWIKVNSGLNRCGTEPGEESVKLAEYVSTLKGLTLTGLYTHAGHSYAATSENQLNEIAKQEVNSILKTADLCEKQGIKITNRSVGSTPTFERAATYKGITEVRPGNAVFFDRVQMCLGIAKKDEVAMTILTQLISKRENRLIFDGGSKAFTTEKGAHGNEGVKGFGQALDYSKLTLTRLSEEHGIIDINELDNQIINQIPLGERVRFIPNHACTALNLFDHYTMINKAGKMERITIDGRGKSQ